MADLHQLLARVEAATGPDRELDAIIYRAFTPKLSDTIVTVASGWLCGGNHENPTLAPELTASIDAAVALVEKVLPEHEWQIIFAPRHDDGRGFSYAGLDFDHDPRLRTSVALRGKRPALAILAALLQAKIHAADHLPSPPTGGV